ncbi:MAG: NADH-quinone oxidoreductase subunit C [Elusimicrobiota bacterium]|nr:NADH-quinone oxidoreductase subunit C [Elusimicrobiota bacterium]
MTNDEIYALIAGKFPKAEKATPPVKDYAAVRIATASELLPLAGFLKDSGFEVLDVVTAIDYLGPVDMKGFIRQPNFNPFLPDGATPEIESAPTAGYPYKPVFDLLWCFYSVSRNARVWVRLELPREGASAPSLCGLYKSADWQERETFDLYGIKYDGHPNLTKILTPSFTVGHPLRKDYAHIKDKYDE